jgi:tRNA A-37 threonylcarbamoyl transferase component Bud32
MSEHLRRRWNDACHRYLPIIDDDSIWRYNRLGNQSDQEQGWKIHVSATVLNATAILNRIAPTLTDCGVQFKAPRSLNDVLQLNSGLLGSYSQVGKIITVYPRNDGELARLARILHQLTYRFRAPSVPFDLRYKQTSNVYYRYGAFKQRNLERAGSVLPAVLSARGELVPDVRENPKPDWVCDPFQDRSTNTRGREPNARKNSSFRVLRALVQRGKGGVYQAVDFESTPPRLCLLKEGRRYGEMDWDGRDGAWRIWHEERVLTELSRSGIVVPKVYARFQVEGSVYLATEFIEGESLQTLLLRQRRRLSVSRILSFGIDVAKLLAQMHRAGWAWRDCKPGNLIVGSQGRLVPIDFEGAERVDRPDPMRWGTRGFVPLTSGERSNCQGLTDDLYALGSVMFLLITGQVFDETKPSSIAKLRGNVPVELRQLVSALLDGNPARRPSAQNVHLRLSAILRRHSQTRRLTKAAA